MCPDTSPTSTSWPASIDTCVDAARRVLSPILFRPSSAPRARVTSTRVAPARPRTQKNDRGHPLAAGWRRQRKCWQVPLLRLDLPSFEMRSVHHASVTIACGADAGTALVDTHCRCSAARRMDTQKHVSRKQNVGSDGLSRSTASGTPVALFLELLVHNLHVRLRIAHLRLGETL